MPLNSNNIRQTKASSLRALKNNLWAANQEESLPARSGLSLSRVECSESGKLREFQCPSIASMPSPAMVSAPCQGFDQEPKLETGKLPSRIPRPEQPTSHTPVIEDATAMDTRESQVRIIDQNRLHAIERKYQTLKSIQSDFVQSLESVDPRESQLLAIYKFVPLVIDDKNKCLIKNDDTILNLPTESVQDLKDRCQAAVKSGFMMLYDEVECVQLAKDEYEASQQKEQLLNRLQSLQSRKMAAIVESIDLMCGSTIGQQEAHMQDMYRQIDKLRKQKEFMEARILTITKGHNEQMQRLQAGLEEQLRTQQEKVAELLWESDTQRNKYADQLDKSLRHKDNTIESIMAESNKQMSLNLNLERLLKESSAELVRTRQEVEAQREHIAFLEREWKEDRRHRVEQSKDMKHEQQEKSTPQLSGDISVQQVLLDLEHVKSLLYKSQDLVGEMRAQSNRDKTKISNYTEEINSFRVKDAESRRTYHALYLESNDKDMQINQLRHQLDSKEEQLSFAYDKLTQQEQDIRRLEEFKTVFMEENARIAQEAERLQQVKHEAEQKIAKLKQELQRFVDFIISKGRPPAILEGIIHVCSICGCIHQQNLDPKTRMQIQSRIGASHGVYLEPMHHQLAQEQEQRNQQKQKREQQQEQQEQHECHTLGVQTDSQTDATSD